MAATDTRGPFTIGVFGEWGTGKTSLMRMVERNLAADENVVTVWFNAWRYEQEEPPIVPLVGTIVRALEEHAGLNQRFGNAGRRLTTISTTSRQIATALIIRNPHVGKPAGTASALPFGQRRTSASAAVGMTRLPRKCAIA
ncbi:P-loop NTPase fold protein [Actinosynnema sp. CS-041913]|uniref:P-loop NTPase fold protein n=1 Tax=Actinosynnema sp. CS-041913 TaxID=3239917 RepID=UPI003D8CC4D6